MSNAAIENVDIIIVGGGGGGGGYSNTLIETIFYGNPLLMSCGGGGGAGDLKILRNLKLKTGKHKVVVGSGGAGGGLNQDGQAGTSSQIANIVAYGGQGGKKATALAHGDGGESGSGYPGGLADSYGGGGGGGSRSPGLSPNFLLNESSDLGGFGGAGYSGDFFYPDFLDNINNNPNRRTKIYI